MVMPPAYNFQARCSQPAVISMEVSSRFLAAKVMLGTAVGALTACKAGCSSLL